MPILLRKLAFIMARDPSQHIKICITNPKFRHSVVLLLVASTLKFKNVNAAHTNFITVPLSEFAKHAIRPDSQTGTTEEDSGPTFTKEFTNFVVQ